jgi:hypothetical protein
MGIYTPEELETPAPLERSAKGTVVPIPVTVQSLPEEAEEAETDDNLDSDFQDELPL